MRKLEEHREYYMSTISEGTKRVLSLREHLHMFMFEPCPDPMHAVSLGEAKRSIYALFDIITKRDLFNSRLKAVRLMPIAFTNCASRVTTVASDYSRGVILMTVVLTTATHFTETVEESKFIEILNSISLILMVISQPVIHKSDLLILDDSKQVLLGLLDKYDITHMLLSHILDPNLWARLGAVHNFSCSRFEGSLSGLKTSIRRASNRSKDWHNVLLKRAIYGENLAKFMDLEVTSDPRTIPMFKKIVSVSKFQGDGFKCAELGFVDISRHNSCCYSTLTRLGIFSKALPASRYDFVEFQKEGCQIGKILNIIVILFTKTEPFC
jgi:hypothetical protein